ncbi:MAG: MATE family efflux transporter [Verrucomicrobiales bacterium]
MAGAAQQGNRLTEGPVLQSLWRLATPIVLANILQSAYQLTDTFWLGRLGGEAVAAVSVSFPLIFLLFALGGGFAIAGSTMVAQFTGAGDGHMVNRVAGQTLILIAFFALLLSTLGHLSAPRLLELMRVEEGVREGALSYLRVTFSGVIFMFGYFMYQSIMRGLGEVRVPLFIVLGTVLLNLVLDPLFIFGWGPVPAMGVAGAAWATVGTQSLAMAIGMALLFGGRYRERYGISWEAGIFRPDWPLIKKVVAMALPASLEQSTRALGISVMIFLVASFGTVTLAVYGIGTRIMSFVIIPGLGLSVATSTLVGQNLGAGQPGRAVEVARLSAWVGFWALSIVGLACFVGISSDDRPCHD